MSAKPRAILMDFQVTPVIIKVGGDSAVQFNDQSNVQSPVSIDSPLMNFHDSHPGPTWTRSESRKKGRLTEMSIKDGDLLQDFPINPDGELASITFQYGLVELIIREVGIPAINDVKLEFVSDQVPFTPKTEPDWSDASAVFPQAVTGVLFKQGNHVIVHKRYQLSNPELTFNINFNRFKEVSA